MIEGPSGKIWLREDGIVCVRAAPGVAHDEHSAAGNLKALRELAGDGRIPVLVDMRETGPVDRAARHAYAHAEFISAQGLLVASPFTRIVANLFLRLGGLSQPARMFTSEDDALKWLKEFLR